MKWYKSAQSWLHQYGGTLSRITFSIFCIGLVVAKLIIQKEVDFVSVCLLLIAWLSFWPKVFSEIPRYIHRIRAAGVDVELHDPNLTSFDEKLRGAVEMALFEQEPPPAIPVNDGEISEIVRTKKIVLHDDNCERARLFVRSDGAVSLELYASSGEHRAAMLVSSEGIGWFSLTDKNGQRRLTLNGSDTPLQINDESGKTRGTFVIDGSTSAGFGVMNPDENICSVIMASQEGGIIYTHSANHKSSSILAAADEHPGELLLIDGNTSATTKLRAGHAPAVHAAGSTD